MKKGQRDAGEKGVCWTDKSSDRGNEGKTLRHKHTIKEGVIRRRPEEGAKKDFHLSPGEGVNHQSANRLPIEKGDNAGLRKDKPTE